MNSPTPRPITSPLAYSSNPVEPVQLVVRCRRVAGKYHTEGTALRTLNGRGGQTETVGSWSTITAWTLDREGLVEQFAAVGVHLLQGPQTITGDGDDETLTYSGSWLGAPNREIWGEPK